MKKLTLALTVFTFFCGPAFAGATNDQSSVVVREVRKSEDKVEVSIHDGTLFVDALSPSGIGGTRLALTSGNWPKKVVVRLKYAADKPFAYLEGPGAALELAGIKADEPRLNLKARLLKPNGFEADIPPTDMKALHVSWIDAYR